MQTSNEKFHSMRKYLISQLEAMGPEGEEEIAPHEINGAIQALTTAHRYLKLREKDAHGRNMPITNRR